MVNESNTSNLVQDSDLKAKLAALATKAELNAEQDKIVKLQTHDLSCFFVNNFFGGDCFHNVFIFLQTLDMLELKKSQGHQLFY